MDALSRCIGSFPFLFSLGFWISNDLIFKYAFPSFLTGKMSDIFGIFCFPFALGFLLHVVLKKWITEKFLFYFSLLLTSLIFSLCNLSKEFYQSFKIFFWSQDAVVVSDPSDLLALLIIPFSIYFYNHKKQKNENISTIKISIIIALTALAFLNTSGGKKENRQLMDGLYFLTYQYEAEDMIQYEKVGIENKISSNEKPIFKWKYIGYYLGENKPDLGNDPNICAGTGSRSKALYKVGGVFSGYRLRIFSEAKEEQKKEIFLESYILSNSFEYTEKLAKGSYSWTISLVFKNQLKTCSELEKEYQIFGVGSSSGFFEVID